MIEDRVEQFGREVMYEKSVWFIWVLTTSLLSYLGYSMPPEGSFGNTLIGTVVGMVAGAVLGFLLPIVAVILLIGAIIYPDGRHSFRSAMICFAQLLISEFQIGHASS
jgi:hypothetical protein